MKFNLHPARGIVKWQLLPVLLGVFLAQTALATDPIYQNGDNLQYLVPSSPPPTIDAAAFYNYGTFEVGFQAYTPTPELFETHNTVNYTNTGYLVANSPNYTNGAFIYLGQASFGSGFNFDTLTTNQIPRKMAGTFYNPGFIRCDSVQDGNNIYTINFGAGLVFHFYLVTSLGQCKVSATNVINSGSIDVGTGGLIQLGGKTVDLTGGQLTVEALLNSLNLLGIVNFFNTFSTVAFNSIGTVGVNTNDLWNPFVSLTAASAISSFSPYPYILSLSNSTSYFDDEIDPFTGVSVHRAVFIVNNSPDASVSASVYFDPLNTYSQFGSFYPGCVNVCWTGTQTDPASGNPVNSYLYLTDDYIWGATTNAFVIGGVPDNFVYSTSPTQVLFGPATTSFVNEFPNVYITNTYAYMNGTLVPSTLTTNASIVNPSGNITNLPGAIKISAANDLNLADTTIAGPNYLLLNSTNQFDGSPGAAIATPYADIYLGVTNGWMTASNLLTAGIPNWSGNIQAWSTRWTMVDTNTGITNDFRVLLVFSQLEPTTAPWIQNLYLHGTNSLVVSDHLNVYSTFYSDARNVTLNTNQIGNGATSLDGEINWYNNIPFNANTASGTQMLPYVSELTNNGAITALGSANFGRSLLVTAPTVPLATATGTLAEISGKTNILNRDLVTLGTNQYTFVNTLTNKSANQVKLAATFDGSLNNLIAAINHAAGSGTAYSTNTSANPLVTAGALASHAFTVSARTAGAAGNLIAALFTPATTATNLTWSGFGTLAGGADFYPGSTNGGFSIDTIINNGLLAGMGGVTLWTTNFFDDGTVSNGTGSFFLQSRTSVITNGIIIAGGDVVLAATNCLVVGGQQIQAGRKLTLWTTNFTDTGVTNGNIWTVGSAGISGSPNLAVNDSGFNFPVKPALGDLLGTTVTNIAPSSKFIFNFWAGTNYGVSAQGYTNNLALGQLILDAKGPSSLFYFNGVGTNNALYVDKLVLQDYANDNNGFNFAWLKIATNMTIYYAQAIDTYGADVSEAIDSQSKLGKNGGRLRWVYSYAGYFSSTNIVYPDGSTNTFNGPLASSTDIDSDSDGTPNYLDPTPFFVPSEVHFNLTTTNLPPLSARLRWTTIPNATNFVLYATNLLATNWLAYTNFKNYYYGNNVAVTNAAHVNSFISPQVYINNPLLPDNSQQTNVWVYDTITNVPHYYRVVVVPWITYPKP